MAITLAEVAKVEKDPKRAYVLQNLIRYAKGIELIPFEKVSSFRVAGLRWRNLPSVAWRAVNEGYTPGEGAVEQVWESMYGFGGEIKFDRVFEYITDVVADPMKIQTDMKLKAMGFEFNDVLINGDTATNPKKPLGLKARIAAMPSRQKVGFAGASASVLDPTASTANARTFFDTLETMHVRTNGGEHNVWFCNEGVKLGVGRVARYLNISAGGFLDVTKDTLGREFPTMYGSPVIDIGYKKDQSTEIIPETETAGDSGTDATSIYCAAFNQEQGLMGAQLNELKAYDPLNGGEQESTPTKLLRIDWWIGFVSFGSYGITRGWNLEKASAWT